MAKPVGTETASQPFPPDLQSPAGWKTVCRVHEYLEVAEKQGRRWVRCLTCGCVLGGAGENYKLRALRRDHDLQDFIGAPLVSGDPYQALYREYLCPGCGTLLDVEVFCPSASPDEPIWDTQLKLD